MQLATSEVVRLPSSDAGNLTEAPIKMAEAEVSLRLALWLLASDKADHVEVAIDGAQLRTADVTHFRLHDFLAAVDCRKMSEGDAWQATYAVGRTTPSKSIVIHSNPGRGDVVADLHSGRTLRAECKKGPLLRTSSSPEYRLIREAIGQLVTIDEVTERDFLAVAVPNSAKFEELATRWRRAPLIRRYGLLLLTVDPSGSVQGFDDTRAAPPVADF